jgi:hypothetical protein
MNYEEKKRDGNMDGQKMKNTKRFLKSKQYLAYLNRPVVRWTVQWFVIKNKRS